MVKANLVVQTEAANKDGVSVEVVELEDGVGSLLGLGISINIAYIYCIYLNRAGRYLSKLTNK
jgi:hypothetical protein